MRWLLYCPMNQVLTVRVVETRAAVNVYIQWSTFGLSGDLCLPSLFSRWLLQSGAFSLDLVCRAALSGQAMLGQWL